MVNAHTQLSLMCLSEGMRLLVGKRCSQFLGKRKRKAQQKSRGYPSSSSARTAISPLRYLFPSQGIHATGLKMFIPFSKKSLQPGNVVYHLCTNSVCKNSHLPSVYCRVFSLSNSQISPISISYTLFTEEHRSGPSATLSF